ncbi:hypothetical protein AGMMS50262_09870 [Bacteroidia bacterium]|nr:hypothetical protein AGMMS50262_09870 [Bacteroidia bacterium]
MSFLSYISYEPNSFDSSQEPLPDFFYEWDEAITQNRTPRFFETEEFSEIIEIYLDYNENEKAKQTINYALRLHPSDEDLIYDILLMLNEFELWNDLLVLAGRYESLSEVWADGHKLTALLHLGMEEDAFLFFKKAIKKYENDKESLTIIYQAMSEALIEVDLFDASVDVISEAIVRLGEQPDLYWLKLHGYKSMELKEEAMAMAHKIETLAPLDATSWHNLGIFYSEVDENEKAIEAYEFAESLGFEKGINHLNLINAYEKNNNPIKALEKANDYLLDYPENYVVNIMAANLSSQMEHWEEAIRYVDDALRVVPEMDALYLYKSSFFLNLGEQKKAILVLKEGIRETDDPEGDLKKQLDLLQEKYPEA